VLASSRVTALAGAFTAIAEGAEGIPFNPAAASVRMPYSTTNVDYDIAAGLTGDPFGITTGVKGTDFDNNGNTSFGNQQNFFFATGGGYIQYGHAAIGVMVSWQDYGISQPLDILLPRGPKGELVANVTDHEELRFFKLDPVVSYGFLDDQLHVGVGIRAAVFQIASDLTLRTEGKNGATTQTSLFTNTAVGAQAGILWMPYALPLRLGAAARSPLVGLGDPQLGGGFKADERGDFRAGAIYFPQRAELPWEIEAGAAVQLWQRPFNIQWQDEDQVPVPDAERWRQTKDGQIEPSSRGARRMLKARYRELPRQRVLLTTSALVSGITPNAVGVESMLSGKLERSGQDLSLTIRGGVEAEVIPWWLVLRAGSYLEPSRFRFSSSRGHGTAGFQVRLFQWDVFGLFDPETTWRVSTAVDVARDYFAWSIGAGMFM
jgi:hypothetical protein